MKKLLVLLFATASSINVYANEVENATNPEQKEKVEKQVTDVVKSPLTDFNLSREEIPLILSKAKDNPYALPEDKTCPGFKQELDALNTVLGPDFDDHKNAENKNLMNKGADMAGKAAIGALKRTVQDAIPYRGWIRKLSGAEKHEKEIADSIAAGTSRRAFLKGYSLGIGCEVNENNNEIVKVEKEITSE